MHACVIKITHSTSRTINYRKLQAGSYSRSLVRSQLVLIGSCFMVVLWPDARVYVLNARNQKRWCFLLAVHTTVTLDCTYKQHSNGAKQSFRRHFAKERPKRAAHVSNSAGNRLVCIVSVETMTSRQRSNCPFIEFVRPSLGGTDYTVAL